MTQPTLPIIDWQPLVAQLRDEAIAIQLIRQLLASLPESLRAIRQAACEQRFDELLMQVHKLHGACAYCRVTGVRQTAKALEQVLHKRQWFSIADLLTALEQQVVLLLQVASSDARLS